MQDDWSMNGGGQKVQRKNVSDLKNESRLRLGSEKKEGVW